MTVSSTYQIELFINGISVDSDVNTTIPNNSTGGLVIGKHTVAGLNIDGKIDQVRFYLGALTQEQITALYNDSNSVQQYPIGGDVVIYETTYTYDEPNGNYIINQVEDAEGGVKQTWFDKLGRVYKEINDGRSDTDDLIIESTYNYDDLGRLTYKEFTDGTILGNTYDSKGYLWKEKYYDDFDDYELDNYNDFTIYENYDSRGNLRRVEGENDGKAFIHQWSYDSRNRVTQQTEHIVLDAANAVQNVISYAYWDNSQLKSITYPATFGTAQNTVSQKYYYNDYGQMTDIKLDSADARSYVYDDSGKVVRTDTYIDLVDTGDVMSAYYSYSNAGLTEDIQYKLNGTLKERYQYAYDSNGMITSETIKPYNSGTNVSKTHTYDDIGRLRQTTIDTTTMTYTYDGIGNRKTQSDGTDSWSYDYDDLFQLQQIDKNNVKEFEYDYDDDTESLGRQTVQREYDSSETLIEEQTFTYHDNGMLLNVLFEDSDGTDPDENEYYLYNGKGQRIVKEFDDGTDTTMTRYLYSGTSILMTANSAGIKTTENILSPSGQIISSRRFDPNGLAMGWYSYNYDIRQSTTAIVNSAGALQNGYSYDAFGNTTETGSLLNEVEYTSAVSDNNTGLYYMNARYYNSNTGRFISQDSYKGSAYEPWTQNLYSYCGNNPINMTDPTGHIPVELHQYDWYAPGENGGGDYGNYDNNGNFDDYDTIYEPGDAGLPASTYRPEKDLISFVGEALFDQAMAEQEALETIQRGIPVFLNALEIDIGVGGGLRGTINLLKEILGFSAGVKHDFVHLRFDDGKFSLGRQHKEGAGYSFFGASYNDSKTIFYPYFSKDKVVKDGVDVKAGLGFEFYFGFGGEATIGFNIQEILEEFNNWD